MSYQVLARKWRPAKFEEMVGQSHVLLALTNALTQQRLHHAYLFTGTRGVGKTSLARLFAKGLNCEQGVTSTPCGVCSSCVEIAQGRFVDLIEVDAASRTKVDDTRELLDNVQYKPSRGRYKVYLIDEVHMLSRSSFNALLKTLEEPPEHVKFLLATTDPQKLPVTVLSRCLQFNLKSLSQDEITKQLDFILTQEQLTFEPQALTLLAKAANGSMRDALSLTDQAIAFGSGQVMHQQVQTMLGSIDAQQVLVLLKALCDADIANLMQTIQQVLSFGADADEVLRSLLELLHQITLTQFAPAAAQQSLYSEQILAFAQQLTLEQVQLYYQLLLTGRKELGFAPDPKSGLEMALLRAVAFVPEKPVKRWHTDEPVTISLTPDPVTPETVKSAPVSSKADTATNNAGASVADNEAIMATKPAQVSNTAVDSSSVSAAITLPQTASIAAEDDNLNAAPEIAAEQAIILSQADSLGFNQQAATETQAVDSGVIAAPAVKAAAVETPRVETPAIKTQPVTSTTSSNEMPIDAYEQFAQASDESYAEFDNDDHNQYQQAEASTPQANVQQTSAAQAKLEQTTVDTTEADLSDMDALLDAVLATNDSLKAELNSLAEEGEQAKKQQAVANPSIKIPAPKAKMQSIENTATVDATIDVTTQVNTSAANDAADRPPWEKPTELPAASVLTAIATTEPEVSHSAATNMAVDNAQTTIAAVEVPTSAVNEEPGSRQHAHTAIAPAENNAPVAETAVAHVSTEVALNGHHEISGDSLDLHWYKIMSQLSIGGRVRQLAVNSVCQRLDNPIPLLLKPDQKHLSAEVAIEQLQIALSELLGEDTKVQIQVGLDPQHETPLELRKRFHRELLANANYALINDDKVQWMFTRLAAQLNPDTLLYPVEKLQAIGQQIPALTVQ
ncbi:DNA polymerase III subunit gamma/tau [Shewanella sp. 3_MG-2023]|uniref:DNA polymerase III subunit gamma/tau n=1 Tax=Shewanella sp. 3_MG-2023 TaxID=3062635 RepID=UPI0026E3232C|nr:DNA polymerase III subunit gamma/tau [Shewanella sp. 3_MG-2023]MDO6777333.1 DNA polymerase III subunit gamma/tau [Shewanella sp. 3_MG-2023]